MDTIGSRVTAWRRRRGGISQKVLADRAGLSQGYVSQIESGIRPLDRKATQVAIATALDITVAQLLGAPSDEEDPALARATVHVPAIRAALVELSAGERRNPVRDRDTLRGAVRQASETRNLADYASVAPQLAGLMHDLSGHGADMAPELIETLFVAQFALRAMGLADLGRQAAEIGVRVAETIDAPHWRGAACFSWIQSFPPESAALGRTLTSREADLLQPVGSREGQETYGRLHLLAALQSAVAADPGTAAAHLDEATAVADHLGEPQRYGPTSAGVTASWFGPTQVELWRVSVAAELGDASTALRSARTLDLTLMPVPVRQVYYHMDMARALAAGKKDVEAVHSMALAERAAPQHFRFSPTSRDLVSTLLHRAKRKAVAGEMSTLARKLGIDVV